LQLADQYSDTGFNNQQSPAYSVATVAVAMRLPLYAGGATQAQVHESRARQFVAASNYEKKKREIENAVQAAFQDMLAAPARNDATDR
jgi:outer membrane protein TolC